MKRLFATMLFLIPFIVGCSLVSTEKEKIYQFLEEVVELEQEFANQQQPLAYLEQEEVEIYSEIIQLPLTQKDQILELADQALTIQDEKLKIILIEKESMNKSEEKFSDIETLIKKVDEKEVESILVSLYEIMKERYSAYEKLHNLYSEWIKKEQELYSQFKEDKIVLGDIENTVLKINELVESITVQNDYFNELTKKYNETKLTLYNQLNIEIIE